MKFTIMFPKSMNYAQKKRTPLFEKSLDELEASIGRTSTTLERSILDLGSANGHFLKLAQQRGWVGYGVELSEPLRTDANKRLGIEVFASLDEFESTHRDVAAIHASHVMEHIPEPQAILRQMHHLLQPSGLLLIEVPNQVKNWTSTLKRSWIKCGLHRTGLLPWQPPVDRLHHTYFFTTQTLGTMLEAAGFRIMTTTTVNSAYYNAELLGNRVRVYQAADALASLGERGPIIRVMAQKI